MCCRNGTDWCLGSQFTTSTTQADQKQIMDQVFNAANEGGVNVNQYQWGQDGLTAAPGGAIRPQSTTSTTTTTENTIGVSPNDGYAAWAKFSNHGQSIGTQSAFIGIRAVQSVVLLLGLCRTSQVVGRLWRFDDTWTSNNVTIFFSFLLTTSSICLKHVSGQLRSATRWGDRSCFAWWTNFRMRKWQSRNESLHKRQCNEKCILEQTTHFYKYRSDNTLVHPKIKRMMLAW